MSPSHGDGEAGFLSPSKGVDRLSPPSALLLPLYDEVTLSYPQLNFPLAVGHPHPPDADLFVGSVVLERVNVGTWRRTVRGRKVLVETRLARVSDEGGSAVARAVDELATFLGRELELPTPDGGARGSPAPSG
jgi:hypothetical protein